MPKLPGVVPVTPAIIRQKGRKTYVQPIGWERRWTKEDTKELKDNIHKAIEETGDKLKDVWKGHSKVDSGLFKATIGKFTGGDIVDLAKANQRAGGASPSSLAVYEWEDWNKLVEGTGVSYADTQNVQSPRMGGPGIQYAREQTMVEMQDTFVKKIEDAIEKAIK